MKGRGSSKKKKKQQLNDEVPSAQDITIVTSRKHYGRGATSNLVPSLLSP